MLAPPPPRRRALAGKRFIEFVKNCKSHGLGAVTTDVEAVALGEKLLNFRGPCVAAQWCAWAPLMDRRLRGVQSGVGTQGLSPL